MNVLSNCDNYDHITTLVVVWLLRDFIMFIMLISLQPFLYYR